MDAIAIRDAAAAGRASGLVGPQAGTSRDAAAARKAADAFEAQFLGQMFQLAMREMPVDDVFGGGPGERLFRDLLTDSWAESAVKAGGVGISGAVMKTLMQAQEG